MADVMLRLRAKYAPGTCEHRGGFQEVRWDLQGCNLRCTFCWSPASRPTETHDAGRNVTPKDVAAQTIAALGDRSRAFIRFTGGEPTLQWPAVLDALKELRTAISAPRPPILFQTNGIEIGNGAAKLDLLAADPRQQYLFEVSFKGTNADEFALLTGRPRELFAQQVTGYRRVLDFSAANPNVCVVAVLGVYHSATLRRFSKYAFVNPKSGNLLFDDQRKWDTAFTEIWQSAPHKWVEALRMSPPGLWNNVLGRCGSAGADILRRFPQGVATNAGGVFPGKPGSADYAERIVSGSFWR